MVALPPDYRSSVQQMRESSRGLLVRLRDERLAQKRSQAPRWAAATPEPQPDGVLQSGAGPVPPDQSLMSSQPVAETKIETQDDIPPPALMVEARAAIEDAAAPVTEAGCSTWLEQFQRVEPLPQHNAVRDRISRAITDSCSDPGQETCDAATTDSKAETGQPLAPTHNDANVAATPLDMAGQTLDERLEQVDSAAPAPAEPSPIPAVVGPVISLEAIPSIGPGVRWRLSQFGILTVNDLATTDVDALIGRLGEIGRLVNVRTWVVEAQDLVR